MVTDSSIRLFRSFLEGAGWTLLHKIFAAAAGLGISVLSARLLGAINYGELQYVLGLLQIALVLGSFGLNQVIVRETAIGSIDNVWGRSRGVLFLAIPLSMVLTTGSALVVGFFSIFLPHSGLAGVFLIGVLATLVQQLAVPCSAILRGLRRVGLFGFGETVRNFVLVSSLVWFALVRPVSGISTCDVMFLRLLAALVGLLTIAVVCAAVTRQLPGGYFSSRSERDIRGWLAQGASLMLIAGASVVFASLDILMIGGIMGPGDVGPYHAATRASEITSFALAITVIPLGAIVAKLYASNEIDELRGIVRKSTLLNSAVGLGLGVFLITLASQFLSLFGEEFIVGSNALRILVIGQVLAVLIGPVELLLIMTGHQGMAALGVVLAVFANVLLNLLLIPLYGIDGAAIGTAITWLARNVILAVFVQRAIWSRVS